MSSYKELEIYRLAYALAIRIHKASLKLPQFETYGILYLLRHHAMKPRINQKQLLNYILLL
jgi:hypothetical protein